MLQATPETIDSTLADSAGGFTVALSGLFPRLLIRNKYTLPIRILAARAVVAGLTITGAGVDWIGGEAHAFGGSHGFAADGYAVRLHEGCSNVSIAGVKVRNADRGFVLDRADHVRMLDCDVSVRQDGMIINGGEHLDIIGNRFHDFAPRPTRCTLPDGSILPGLSRIACEARDGKWKDGDHSDAIQLRNGIRHAIIAYNRIENISQGIGQMDGPTDLPCDDILVLGNQVAVSGFHSITIERTTNLVVMRNKTWQTTGRRSPLRLHPEAISIDNTVLSP